MKPFKMPRTELEGGIDDLDADQDFGVVVQSWQGYLRVKNDGSTS